jgi:hypothetical protein
VHAAWFAVAALIAVLEMFWPSMKSGLDVIRLIYGFTYAWLAFRKAYGTTFLQALTRITAVLLVYYTVVGVVAVSIAMAIIFRHKA